MSNKKNTELNHTDRGHAEFSPSGIKPISKCPGYHGKDGKDGNTKPSVLGTFVHEALETLDPKFTGVKIKKITLKWVVDKLDKLRLKHDDITFEFDDVDVEEMNWLFKTIKKMERKNLLKIFGQKVGKNWGGVNVFEVQLDMDLGKNKNFGTCDRLTISPNGSFGLLADYKTGVSAIDWPRDNHQAVNYAVGVFQKYPDLETLLFSFYVPQNGRKPQTQMFSRSDLPNLQSYIDNPISKAKQVRPLWEGGKSHPPKELLSANDHCRFCRHLTRCEIPAQEIMDAFDVMPELDMSDSEKSYLLNIEPTALIDPESHPEDVEKLWLIAKRMETWAASYRSKVTALGNAGLSYPTLKLQSRKGRVSIVDPEALVKLAVSDYGVDQSEALSVCTPAFAKLAKLTSDDAGFREAAVDQDIVKTGATTYFMKAPKIPAKINLEK